MAERHVDDIGAAMIASSYAISPRSVAGWNLHFPKTLLSLSASPEDPEGDKTGVLWQDSSDHSACLAFPDLTESEWFLTTPSRWKFDSIWDWDNDPNAFARALLAYELVDSAGAMQAILGAWLFTYDTIQWQTNGIAYGPTPDVFVPNPWAVKRYCGVQARLYAYWHDPNPYPGTWHQGKGTFVNEAIADVSEAKILFYRRDIQAPQKNYVSGAFTNGGSQPPIDMSYYFQPIYTPPLFSDVLRPWSQWEAHIFSSAYGTTLDAIVASGSIEHQAWTQVENGAHNWSCWNPASHRLSNPYGELAAHGFSPPYPAWLYAYMLRF